MSHADILDVDRGHIFRKHRHKNNKKSCCYLRENGKKPAVARAFARQLPWGAYIKSAISHVCCAYTHIFDAESYNSRVYTWRGVQTERRVAARSLTLHDRPTNIDGKRRVGEINIWRHLTYVWENKQAIGPNRLKATIISIKLDYTFMHDRPTC